MHKRYFVSLDPAATPSGGKQSGKAFLKKILEALGLYKSPHGQACSETFFVDLKLSPQTFDVACFVIVARRRLPSIIDAFVNGRAVRLTHCGDNRFSCAAEHLVEYENLVAFPLPLKVRSVSIEAELPAAGLDERQVRAVAYRVTSGGAGDAAPVRQGQGIPREPLHHNPVVSCILAAGITDPRSDFRGLYYPAFDVYAKSYRLSSWTWTNGIIVKAFLEVEKEDDFLRQKALSLADRLLDFQEREGDEQGGIMARWDILNQCLSGLAPQLATNDSAYIGSNAFLPAYDATGDEKYLAAATAVGDWIIRRGMTPEGHLSMGKRLDTGEWVKNHLFVDSGFTSGIFAGLYARTGEQRWQTAAATFENWYIDKLFDRDRNYFWWNWYNFRGAAKAMFARGQAWALDGVISTFQATGDDRYRDVMRRTAETLCARQSDAGGWYYHLDKPAVGLDPKGTPIIAYHLARIYRFVPDRRFLQAAQKAHAWCTSMIRRDIDDARECGGITSWCEEGTICGARGVEAIFTYAQSYYMLLGKLLSEIEARDASHVS